MNQLKYSPTKEQYERYLNDQEWDREMYEMAGKFQTFYFMNGKYGTCQRKYDPIAFHVGFNDYQREYKSKT